MLVPRIQAFELAHTVERARCRSPRRMNKYGNALTPETDFLKSEKGYNAPVHGHTRKHLPMLLFFDCVFKCSKFECAKDKA